MRHLVGLLIGLSFWQLPVAATVDPRSEEELSPAAAWELLEVDAPAIATPEVLKAMRVAADAGTLEAAEMLVSALAFNFNPDVSNESRSLPEMVPAIGFLQAGFGSKVLPLLFARGVATEHEWLRQRCVLAARTIGSAAEIDSYSTVFSLASSANTSAIEFGRLLQAPELQVELYSPARAHAEQVSEAVLKLRKKE